MKRYLPLAILAACGGTPPPAGPTNVVTAPAIDAAPPPPVATVPFGRFASAQPDGYTLDSQGDTIAFEHGETKLILLDGADQTPPTQPKCLGYLEAFASGVLTGLTGAELTVDVVHSDSTEHSCRLDGTISNGAGLVEAAILDLGNGGVALAICVHHADDAGAPAAFARVVDSIVAR
jgi:hypothetical protein